MRRQRMREDELQAAREYIAGGWQRVQDEATVSLGLLVRLIGHVDVLAVENATLTGENTRLRAALAGSDKACTYCQLPPEEFAKCQSGFPGCGRMDDLIGCPEFGASMVLLDVTREMDRMLHAEQMLSACRADLDKPETISHWGLEAAAAKANLAGMFEKAGGKQQRRKLMTTKVTVSANGDHYPARVVLVRKHEAGDPEEMVNKLVASGEHFDVHCGTLDTVTITEEYHPEGYPKPAVAKTDEPAAE